MTLDKHCADNFILGFDELPKKYLVECKIKNRITMVHEMYNVHVEKTTEK